MASNQGIYDNAANVPYWAVNSSIVKNYPTHAAPNATNAGYLYANTTADVYITDETIGVFGVDAQEVGVNGKVAHTGWVLKTTGSGGRAGRIQQEVLVAQSQMIRDGDAQIYANVGITLTSTSANTVVYGGGNTASFTVSPTLTGNTSATLTYQWQVNSGGTWGNVSNGTPANTTYSGATSATLVITPTWSDANGYKYRSIVTAADQGVTATSANSTVTVTAP